VDPIVDPPLAALDRLKAAFVDYYNANGMDPFIGKRLPRMLRAAGLLEVEVNPIVYAYRWATRGGLMCCSSLKICVSESWPSV